MGHDDSNKLCQKRIFSTAHQKYDLSFLVTQCQIKSGLRPKLILEAKKAFKCLFTLKEQNLP